MATFAGEEGPRLLRFAFLLTGNNEDAQDLVQTVFWQLSRRGVSDLVDPAMYARRCLVNLNHSMGRRVAAHLRALSRHPVTDSAADHAPDVANRDAMKRALEVLPPRQRAAVVLRYYEDLSDEQMAEALSCAPGTVRSLLSRALPKLRRQLCLMDEPTEGATG